MSTKALFLDLDGTLLTDDKQITAGNRSAIKRALDQGHKVVIDTGRPLVSAVKQAKALGLDTEGCYVIAFNGGIIMDMGSGKIIHRSTVPLELVFAVMEEAERWGLHSQTYDEEFVLVEPKWDNDSVRRYCSLIKVEHRVIESVRQMTQEPPKVLIIDYSASENLSRFHDWVLERFGERLDVFFSCDYYVEVVSGGTNKGNALLQLADLLGIPREDTIAAGDAANDLSMLDAAGLGVCMVNGTDEAKSHAGYITQRDNNHDGVAEIIERFML